MFGALLGKECKQILHSLVYYLYLIIFVWFMATQLGQNVIIKAPEPGEEFYGLRMTTDEQIIMGKTLAELTNEINWNSFATYPVGFYKQVILSDSEIEKLKEILEECSGKDWDQLMQEQTEHFADCDSDNWEEVQAVNASYLVEPVQDLSYEQFVAEMKKVSKLIGKGSSFEQSQYEAKAEVEMTYEDALEEYQAICEKDGITGAYMRLFCDYAGILLGLLPVFLGVTRAVRDKRAKADQVIYARTASSFQIVWSRYLSNVVMMMAPIFILALMLETSYLYQAKTLGVSPHLMAFLIYPVIWLLPTILFVLAGSFLLSELLNGIVAIVVQVLWAFGSLMSSSTLVGNFGLTLIPRWNTFGNTTQFLSERGDLIMNRLLYTGAGLFLMVLTTWIYRYKRKGGQLLHGKKREAGN